MLSQMSPSQHRLHHYESNLHPTAPSFLNEQFLLSAAVLAAQQYGAIDVVTVNQTFNISTIIVDKITGIQIGNVQWGNFTWNATASLYAEVQYQSNGTLISTTFRITSY